MALPTPQSPTLAAPRITPAKFLALLKTKASPAVPESGAVFDTLLASGVDPSFALAQFRVESQYGTAGYAKETGSWGNMLYDSSLCLLASGKITKTTSDGTKFTYATYSNYVNAVLDYCRYVHDYAEHRGLTTIYEATAEWIGKTPGAKGHISYVNTIISDMVEYEHPEGTFYETGDKMIYSGAYVDRATGKVLKRHPIKVGQELYRGTNGDLLKLYSGTPGNALFLGPVNGSWEWGVVIIGTSLADPNGTAVYIKNPVASSLVLA